MDHIVDDQGSLRDFLKEAELMQYFELFRDILKVSKLSQLKFVALEDLAQIGLSKPEQRRYKKIYSKYFPNAYKIMLRKILNVNKKAEPPRQDLGLMPSENQSITDIKVPRKHIISIEDITINKELGMGQFGVVQQGTWTTGNQRLQVAIKCLGNERMTSNSTEFLKEAAVMHSIEHPNIVRLYGVVLHLDSLMLVTELAPLRSLLECLREVTLRSNFSVAVLCEFAEQICDGMTYLENKRLIHRDLAARNILVFSKNKVKISDFGLSRALGVGKDYYQTNYNVNLKLPVAWCAPECILYLKFTSSSDVWAFGVCLWEMFTYGFQPWAAFSGQQILEAIDAPNFQRLERPECCPDAYYSLMLECWSHDPNDRPKFKELGPRLPHLRPDEVEVLVSFKKTEDGRRCNFLEYKAGQRITVLGKETYTKSAMWYGVLPGGACGMFDPNHTKLLIRHEKGCGDFSQSLLDEIDSIFRNLDHTKRVEEVRTMQSEVEAALRAHHLSQMEKKKGGSHSGTMKPMSAHDERTLNTAVALANELTTKSMNDLEGDSKPLHSPNERSKFHFKFPLVSSLQHHHHHDSDKDASSKAERRNFSEEAKSVPDIQATITEESKLAYTSLIEQPTPSSSLITQINHDAKNPAKPTQKPSTIPKPAPRSQNAPQQFFSLQKHITLQTRRAAQQSEDTENDNVNAIPLPPRGTKPKLVDKPRHIRKYPLRLPSADTHAIISHSIQIEAKPQTIIYQNTVRCTIPTIKINDEIAVDNIRDNNEGVDVFDGPENAKVDTNPFTTTTTNTTTTTAMPDVDAAVPGPSSSNPFKCYLDDETKDSNSEDSEGAVGGETDFEEEATLKKDYVSVEDLLEFADQKPSSRQRGVESDEVRIMNKVLKQQVTPEKCLEAIEFCDWNIHLAIKLLRVKISVGNTMNVSFEDCRRELENADGDIVKAAAILVLSNKNV
ncbi:activated Cdc42 kinase-like isoform X3 [Nymphalis io]|uniref:activated Cdc42 kinase-like isoform X3 n=1 Tax=Inachis io TaxID=171585 RepID=UPI0021692F12|nr:activated Cdc42 kinase-like isoform X3 [Nymphalis io]